MQIYRGAVQTKKLLSQQKHAVQIINNTTRFDHTNDLFKSQKILNIYKLNILSVAVFVSN